MLYFKLFDVITWKHIESAVPVDPDALVLMLVEELIAGQSGCGEKAVK